MYGKMEKKLEIKLEVEESDSSSIWEKSFD